jgi:hypothetical protein
MRRLMRWSVLAGLTLTAAAHAQTVVPVSDFGTGGPYAAMPPQAAWPRPAPQPLTPAEIAATVRARGYAPLGGPQQRGIVYTISAIDPGGDDGTLVIDARSGRIIRFLPASRMGNRFNEMLDMDYGPVGPLPPPAGTRRGPRPPLPIPHVARRPAAPPPKAAPPQQSAQAPWSTPAVEAKAAVQIQPTQEMPKAQGLD